MRSRSFLDAGHSKLKVKRDLNFAPASLSPPITVGRLEPVYNTFLLEDDIVVKKNPPLSCSNWSRTAFHGDIKSFISPFLKSSCP